MKQLKRWRAAKRAFASARTYENAVELQAANRSLRATVRDNIKTIDGGKA